MPEIDRKPDISSIAPLTLPGDRQLVMRVMPMPADANGNGDIFGGWIMAQVDVAGAVLPARIAKGRIATVAVNQFVFKQPVSISDLLSFYAKVERVGRTSVTVNVEVYAERNPADLHVVKVTEANLTYVAIDMTRAGRGRFRSSDESLPRADRAARRPAASGREAELAFDDRLVLAQLEPADHEPVDHPHQSASSTSQPISTSISTMPMMPTTG